MPQRLNILSVCPSIPRPDTAAGDRRYFALLELLAKTHQIDLFAADSDDSDGEEKRYIRDLEAVGVNVLRHDTFGWFRGMLQLRRYDLGLFEFWHTAAYYGSLFRQYQPGAKLIIDTVDVHFRREETAVELGLLDKQWVSANRQREIDAYRSADAVIVVTEEDRRALEQVDIRGLHTIPIIVPLRPRPKVLRKLELLFVGNLKFSPNADGLTWFVQNVWPRIRAQVHEAALTVVSSSTPPELQALDGRDGISVAGFVPSTEPYLDRAAVSIAPLRFGGGMKGKVTEAMACGLPVVTTSAGAQGYGIVSGEHAIVADDPAGFAAAVIRLLTDRDYAERVGENGRKLVSALCTPEAVVDRLERLVAEVGPAKAPTASFAWHGRSAYVRLMTRVRRVGRWVFPKTAVPGQSTLSPLGKMVS